MKSCRAGWFLFLFVCVFCFAAPPVKADIMCDATLTTVDELGSERIDILKTYVKSNRVKLEWQESSSSIILRSDLQTILTILPLEATYSDTSFSEIYMTPFSLNSLIISPGFNEPVVEFIDTGETELINGLSCKKYVISEIASFRLLQYTITRQMNSFFRRRSTHFSLRITL